MIVKLQAFPMTRQWLAGQLLFLLPVVCAVSLVSATEQVSTEGGELYHDYCSVCHGDNGDGQSRARDGLVTPPQDFTAPGLGDIMSREDMIDTVLNGKPETAMVGWKTRLSTLQASAVVDYIRSRFMSFNDETAHYNPSRGHADHGSRALMTQPMPYDLSGRFDAGKTFYNNNCATCHGRSGNGNGPRAYFINPKPRDFLSQKSRHNLNRPLLFRAIKYGITGKEMPAWGKVLGDQEIADVAEYVFRKMILHHE